MKKMSKFKMGVAGILLLLLTVIFIRAHGSYDYQMQNLQVLDIDATNLPENVNIVFYKEDCPYCQAAEKPVIFASKFSYYDTVFVDLGTVRGQQLKNILDVKYASSDVKIRKGKTKIYLTAKKVNSKYQPTHQPWFGNIAKAFWR